MVGRVLAALYARDGLEDLIGAVHQRPRLRDAALREQRRGEHALGLGDAPVAGAQRALAQFKHVLQRRALP